MTRFYVVEPCASANGVEIRLTGRRLDLKKAEKALASVGEVVGSGGVVLLVRAGGYSVSVYASGRMMVKGGGRVPLKKAEALAAELFGALERGGAVVGDAD